MPRPEAGATTETRGVDPRWQRRRAEKQSRRSAGTARFDDPRVRRLQLVSSDSRASANTHRADQAADGSRPAHDFAGLRIDADDLAFFHEQRNLDIESGFELCRFR